MNILCKLRLHKYKHVKDVNQPEDAQVNVYYKCSRCGKEIIDIWRANIPKRKFEKIVSSEQSKEVKK